MTHFVPALSLLTAFLIITLAVLAKVKTEQLPALLEAKNVVLLFAAGLFCILLIVHLFKEQPWTADLLKVVAGILAGALATRTATSNDKPKNSVTQTAIGNDIQQAGRDIHNIKKMVGDLQNVTDSVVNQFQSIQQSIAKVSANVGSHAARREYFHIEIPVPDERFYTEAEVIDNDPPPFFDGEATRKFLNRRLALFLTIPGVREKIRLTLQSIEDAGWWVHEVQFDISPKMVGVGFNCEQRISIESLFLKEM